MLANNRTEFVLCGNKRKGRDQIRIPHISVSFQMETGCGRELESKKMKVINLVWSLA